MLRWKERKKHSFLDDVAHFRWCWCSSSWFVKNERFFKNIGMNQDWTCVACVRCKCDNHYATFFAGPGLIVILTDVNMSSASSCIILLNYFTSLRDAFSWLRQSPCQISLVSETWLATERQTDAHIHARTISVSSIKAVCMSGVCWNGVFLPT